MFLKCTILQNRICKIRSLSINKLCKPGKLQKNFEMFKFINLQQGISLVRRDASLSWAEHSWGRLGFDGLWLLSILEFSHLPKKGRRIWLVPFFFKKGIKFYKIVSKCFFCKGFLISILTQSYSISIVFNSSGSLAMMKSLFFVVFELKIFLFFKKLFGSAITICMKPGTFGTFYFFMKFYQKSWRGQAFPGRKCSSQLAYLIPKSREALSTGSAKTAPKNSPDNFIFTKFSELLITEMTYWTSSCSILIQMNFKNLASFKTRVKNTITLFKKQHFIDIE